MIARHTDADVDEKMSIQMRDESRHLASCRDPRMIIVNVL